GLIDDRHARMLLAIVRQKVTPTDERDAHGPEIGGTHAVHLREGILTALVRRPFDQVARLRRPWRPWGPLLTHATPATCRPRDDLRGPAIPESRTAGRAPTRRRCPSAC